MTSSDLVQLRVSAAEVMGKRVIDVPFIPGKIRPADDVVFTPAAAKEWKKTYPTCGWCPILARPDEDANDALRLCGVMREKGWGFTISPTRPSGWVINLWIIEEKGYRTFDVKAETLPLAITLAALRAMGKGEEKTL